MVKYPETLPDENLRHVADYFRGNGSTLMEAHDELVRELANKLAEMDMEVYGHLVEKISRVAIELNHLRWEMTRKD